MSDEKSYLIICVCGAEFKTHAEWQEHYDKHGLRRCRDNLYEPRSAEAEKP